MKKLIVFISFLMILTACGTDTSNSPPNNNGKEEKTTDYQTQTFDNYGREVVVTEKPQKVITLGPNTTELMIALGLEDYVIGNSLNNHSQGPLPEYKEAYEKIPELTHGSITREAVTTSGADFIYGIDWEFGEEGLDIDELADLGITTYMNSASTLEETFQEIEDIGKIFHVEDKAEAFIANQKDRIDAVEKKVSSEEEVKVLVYDSGGNGVFTAGGTNFETLLIELAGGKNIFDDITDKEWTTVSYEEVVARDPDVIVVHDYDTSSYEQKIEDIKNDPALSQLESVQNDKFVVITLESVLPGTRMAYTLETLAEGFHPDAFK